MAGFGGSTGVSKEYVDRAIAQSTADAVSMSYYSNFVRVNDPTTGMAIGVNPDTDRLFVMLPGGTVKYYTLTPMQ